MRRRIAITTGVVLALAGTAVATEQLAQRARPPAEATVTIAASAPLFTVDGLVGGEEIERCTVLTNLGPQPADVSLFGSASEAALSPWLPFELVRGTLPDGTPPGDCTGFAADALDYGSGDPGVVFAGTLASFPDSDAGIADPTRWAAGESHAYLLRISYTGTNPQQGLRTVQDFHWGASPFDDRGPEPIEPGPPTPTPAPGDGGTTLPTTRQCTTVSFGPRGYIGGRAITKPKQIKKKKKKASIKAKKTILGYPTGDLLREGEDADEISGRELERRATLLGKTKQSGALALPTLVVRLTARKDNSVAVRVGLRKGKKVTAPRRWRWVRVRLNAGSTKSRLKYPFTGTAKLSQFKTGYNQIDIALDRGRAGKRVKGLQRVVKRSFAFVVRDSGDSGSGSACLLG